MFDDDGSVVLHLGAGVIMQPENFQLRQFYQMSNFPDIRNIVLSQVELLSIINALDTCSLLQVEKSFKELILLTLRDTTSRLGIFSMSFRS